MESSLHRQLKDRYAADRGGRSEVRFEGFRIDAVAGDGTLIEVQAAPLGALREKLGRLLPGHRVLVVKPVVVARRIVRRDSADGPDLWSRRASKRGDPLDVFDELVALARTFPHPNLTIDVVAVAIDEVRVGRGRGARVVDRRLGEIVSTATLRTADDLWSLLPGGLDGPFTTLDFARLLGRPVAFAQRLAYCLRHAGAVESRGVSSRRRVYARPDPSALAVPAVIPARR